MSFWDIASVIGVMIVLAVAWWLLRRMDQHAKFKNRDRAYQLLDMENPPVREMKTIIRNLQLYGGRLRRNKEFHQLRQRLSEKLATMESASSK